MIRTQGEAARTHIPHLVSRISYPVSRIPMTPTILTTLVGSYPIPAWLAAFPSEQHLVDATRVVFSLQESAGLDVLTDGELYRFDVNHPDTNGMIDYFTRRLGGIRSEVRRSDRHEFAQLPDLSFRAKPAGVVEGKIDEGTLDLPADFERASALTARPIRFTLTGPHMLCKTLLDRNYGSRPDLARDLAHALASQVSDIRAEVIQVDEANLPGHPGEWEWAAEVDNLVLDSAQGEKAVHLCFGNYGGQTVQQGTWNALVSYLSALRADHVLLEMTRRPPGELEALRDVSPRLRFGIGVIDIKSNVVETAEEVANRIDAAARVLGPERIAYVNPDCGLWMLPRSVADRKIRALVAGRDLYEGRS